MYGNAFNSVTTIFTWANEAGADLSKKLLNLGKIMM